jgi:hypothetical protein
MPPNKAPIRNPAQLLPHPNMLICCLCRHFDAFVRLTAISEKSVTNIVYIIEKAGFRQTPSYNPGGEERSVQLD